MTHITPRSPEELTELTPVLEGVKAAMGFVPTSMLTMAHMPQLTVAFSLLGSTVFGGDLKGMMAAFSSVVPDQEEAEQNLPPELVQLIALATSLSSGCLYCQAHTSHNAHRSGASDDKLAEILGYSTSERYTDTEKAVLDLAFAAGRVPNEATADHFETLRAHFTSRQIVQIVAVIAMFGFLNRWNDTMATTLEAMPAEFAATTLDTLGWTKGKHA